MATSKPSITNSPRLPDSQGVLLVLVYVCDCILYKTGKDTRKEIKVVIARRSHLFPFRTEKLSFATPMVLRKWESR